jgi:hypothetical protein
MRHLFLILILIYSLPLLGQKDNDIYQILRSDYSLKFDHDTILYTNRISTRQVEQNSKSIKASPIVKFKTDSIGNYIKDSHYHRFIPVDSIVLTAQEDDTVLTAFLIQENDFWLNPYFPNSKFISRDTIFNILKDSHKSWDYFSARYGSGYHVFKKPVFLRNNTVCIYYSEYHCGFLCGRGSIKIFIKENGKWHLFSELAEWVS